jgi:hypothetical protein
LVRGLGGDRLLAQSGQCGALLVDARAGPKRSRTGAPGADSGTSGGYLAATTPQTRSTWTYTSVTSTRYSTNARRPGMPVSPSVSSRRCSVARKR